MSYQIITDTSSNLSYDYTKRNNVIVIPFLYNIDGVDCNCTDLSKFNGKSFYDAMRSGAVVNTTQINPQRYMNAFEPILERGEDILYIGMSSGISGAYSSSLVAARNLEEEYPNRKIICIDTLSASLAEGIQVIRAVQYKNRGITIEEAAEKLNKKRHNMYQIFTVDNLKYLSRTGRISNAKAIVGNVLGIKPILVGNSEGKIVTFQNERGRKNAIKCLANKYDELVHDHENATIAIAGADCDEDIQYLISLINKNKPPKHIITECYEPVTGSHVGPGTLALFFDGEDDCRIK